MFGMVVAIYKASEHDTEGGRVRRAGRGFLDNLDGISGYHENIPLG
jgi:hypothetical protein